MDTPQNTPAATKAMDEQIAEYEKTSQVIDLMNELKVGATDVLLTLADLAHTGGLHHSAGGYKAAAEAIKLGTLLQYQSGKIEPDDDPTNF